ALVAEDERAQDAALRMVGHRALERGADRRARVVDPGVERERVLATRFDLDRGVVRHGRERDDAAAPAPARVAVRALVAEAARRPRRRASTDALPDPPGSLGAPDREPHALA